MYIDFTIIYSSLFLFTFYHINIYTHIIGFARFTYYILSTVYTYILSLFNSFVFAFNYKYACVMCIMLMYIYMEFWIFIIDIQIPSVYILLVLKAHVYLMHVSILCTILTYRLLNVRETIETHLSKIHLFLLCCINMYF